MSKTRNEPKSLYIAPNALAGSRCSVYLIDALPPGQNPRDICPTERQQWRQVAIIDAVHGSRDGRNFNLVACEDFVDQKIKDDLLYGMAGNIYDAVTLPDGKLVYPEDVPSKHASVDSPSP